MRFLAPLLLTLPALVAAVNFDSAKRKLLGRQPIRCLTSTCKAFASSCGSGADCVSGNCYEGKCALAETCRVAGKRCRIHSPGSCCSNQCQPVMLRSDCKRLMNIPLKNSGTSVEKLHCDTLGVCADWSGTADAGAFLTTPWSVNIAKDSPAKYTMFKSITFTEGVDGSGGLSLVKDFYAERRMGQEYDDVDAGSLHPGTISDAGVLKFKDCCGVDAGKYTFMTDALTSVTYCIAPIVKKESGAGGGYFAVGKNCCGTTGTKADKFECATGTEGVVVNNDRDKYATALQSLETAHGASYHNAKEKFGIESKTPTFVRLVPNARAEQKAATPDSEYHYIPLVTKDMRTCVAPLSSDSEGDKKAGYSFWAFGRGKECAGDAIAACKNGEIRSGLVDNDLTGDLQMSALKAQLQFGLTPSEGKPLFVGCSDEVLVGTPSS